jgi:hypothetical protein
LTLQRHLAKDPQFFVDCLKVLYRPRHEAEEKPEEKLPDESEKAARAKRIWRLLRDWQTMPGTTKEGFSADRLRAWVKIAREKARECDRLEVCDITLGETFARSPEDVDGGIPLIGIREVMEECESAKLEHGFFIGLHNLRGVVSKGLYEGGKQERELAAKYEKYANICSRWPRTAKVFREVAEGYLQQAEREDERARGRG